MTLRVAIVGAGPAGIYAADILLKHEKASDVSIDLFERLPAPYGLVRYGVAPDHPRIKGIVNSLREILDSGKIRLFGNVNYGTDITMQDLKEHYHAVVFATGAMRDAELNIPGIDLPGSFGAAQFVSWYNGHPDVPRNWTLDAREVAVIGNGNVALDVARMLVKQPEDLFPTEVPEHVYQALQSSKVTDVHIFGRRSPHHVKFTPLELRELGELRNVDIVLYNEDFVGDLRKGTLGSSSKQKAVMERIFASWRTRGVGNAPRRLHFHFLTEPLEINGSGSVESFQYGRNSLTSGGEILATGEVRKQDVQAVYRAVGYFGSPLEGIAFDYEKGVIPNHKGAVLDGAGSPTRGLFVTGWIKRGPVGLIGHTKSDAQETVDVLLGEQSLRWSPVYTDPNEINRLLKARGCEITSLAGWRKLDEAEVVRGKNVGKERLKVVKRQEMVTLSNS